jgi:phosphatidylglycerol:prolipoprotein diacylglycerol transferase
MPARLPLCDPPRAVHPILFRIGSYEVPSYGLLLTLAFAAGIWVARRRAAERGIDEDRLLDVCMLILFTSIVGARLLWVATHLEMFRAPHGSWSDALNPFRSGRYVGFSGLSMLGGVVLATVSALAFLAWRRLPVLATADVLAPSVALGEGITRIGCFLNGCCFGKPSDLPWAIKFPSDCVAGRSPVGQFYLHPTQLYTSLFGLLLFFFLRRQLMKKHFNGQIFAFYLILSGAFRFGIDFIRYYEDLGNLLINQFIAVGLIIAGIILYVISTRRKIEPA